MNVFSGRLPLIFFLFQKGATHHGSFSEFLFDFIHGGIEPALFFKIRFWRMRGSGRAGSGGHFRRISWKKRKISVE